MYLILCFILCFALISFTVFADDEDSSDFDCTFQAAVQPYSSSGAAAAYQYITYGGGNLISSYGQFNWQSLNIIVPPSDFTQYIYISGEVGIIMASDKADIPSDYLSIVVGTSSAYPSEDNGDSYVLNGGISFQRSSGGDVIYTRDGDRYAYFVKINGYLIVSPHFNYITVHFTPTNIWKLRIMKNSSTIDFSEQIYLRMRNVQIHTYNSMYDFLTNLLNSKCYLPLQDINNLITTSNSHLYSISNDVYNTWYEANQIRTLISSMNSKLNNFYNLYDTNSSSIISRLTDIRSSSSSSSIYLHDIYNYLNNPLYSKYTSVVQNDGTITHNKSGYANFFTSVTSLLENMVLYNNILIDRHNAEIEAGFQDAYDQLNDNLDGSLVDIARFHDLDSSVPDWNSAYFGEAAYQGISWFTILTANLLANQNDSHGLHDQIVVVDALSSDLEILHEYLGGE